MIWFAVSRFITKRPSDVPRRKRDREHVDDRPRDLVSREVVDAPDGEDRQRRDDRNRQARLAAGKRSPALEHRPRFAALRPGARSLMRLRWSSELFTAQHS